MTESAEGYFLVAFAINAVSPDRAQTEWTVAALGTDGNWYQWDGAIIHPFHTIPIEHPAPPIPDGWIEHIQEIAGRDMSHAAPTVSLIEALGIKAKPQPSLPIPRRF